MSAPPEPAPLVASGGFLLGVRTAFTSVFGFVIAFTYIGFGALCHDYGLSMGWAMLSTALQWAGPAQVLLVTGMGPGTALFETAVAVSLSSVRLFPIVVALIPVVRQETTRVWQLLIPVHFMAISVWIELMCAAPKFARGQRLPFCNGVGLTLLSIGGVHRGRLQHSGSSAGRFCRWRHVRDADLVPGIGGTQRRGLLLDKLALGLGIVIGPALAFSKVDFDLLWTGIIAGTLAYGVHRAQRRWKAAS